MLRILDRGDVASHSKTPCDPARVARKVTDVSSPFLRHPSTPPPFVRRSGILSLRLCSWGRGQDRAFQWKPKFDDGAHPTCGDGARLHRGFRRRIDRERGDRERVARLSSGTCGRWDVSSSCGRGASGESRYTQTPCRDRCGRTHRCREVHVGERTSELPSCRPSLRGRRARSRYPRCAFAHGVPARQRPFHDGLAILGKSRSERSAPFRRNDGSSDAARCGPRSSTRDAATRVFCAREVGSSCSGEPARV